MVSRELRMIENSLPSEQKVPNFLDNICVEGLTAFRPEAANIIQ